MKFGLPRTWVFPRFLFHLPWSYPTLAILLFPLLQSLPCAPPPCHISLTFMTSAWTHLFCLPGWAAEKARYGVHHANFSPKGHYLEVSVLYRAIYFHEIFHLFSSGLCLIARYGWRDSMNSEAAEWRGIKAKCEVGWCNSALLKRLRSYPHSWCQEWKPPPGFTGETAPSPWPAGQGPVLVGRWVARRGLRCPPPHPCPRLVALHTSGCWQILIILANWGHPCQWEVVPAARCWQGGGETGAWGKDTLLLPMCTPTEKKGTEFSPCPGAEAQDLLDTSVAGSTAGRVNAAIDMVPEMSTSAGSSTPPSCSFLFHFPMTDPRFFTASLQRGLETPSWSWVRGWMQPCRGH